MRFSRILFVFNILAILFVCFGYSLSTTLNQIKSDCEIIKLEKESYEFYDICIITKNYTFGKECLKKTGVSYYSSLCVKKNKNIIWKYEKDIDPSGISNFGIKYLGKSPKNNVITFVISGNYSHKLILIFKDGKIEILNASNNIDWVNYGDYIFANIVEDTPVGFMVYDLQKRKVILKTDKLITEWKKIKDKKYLLIEEPFLLSSKEDKKKNKYILDLNNEKAKLIKHKLNMKN